MGPVLAVATFVVFGPFAVGGSVVGLRLVLMADLVYVLIIATLVMQRVARIVAARRARSAGSRLHLRLTGVFAIVALVPTVLVAIFAGLTINIGLEGWFSDRVSNVVGTSLAAAQAYESEQREAIARDTLLLAADLNSLRNDRGIVDDGELRKFLNDENSIQTFLLNNLTEIYIIDGQGNIRARGDGSYLFNFEKPESAVIAQARQYELVLIEDPDRDEYRGLMPLRGYLDHYIYVTREVDGNLLKLLDDTQQTATLYQQLETQRGRMVFDFGLFYLGFAVTLILASIWLGLWFAERLSRPVGRLAGAAQQVGMGDLSVQVREERGDDEIAMLGRYFNQMTRQLKAQRETLLDNTQQIERRRRLFDSVLSSVTSGVIGLDAGGAVTFVNKSAERLLNIDASEARVIGLAVPEFGALFDRLPGSKSEVVQEEIQITRYGKTETLLVRLSLRRHEDGALDGYVVAFEDVTDLVSAQRMAAWGDVARRIAHEIKNPLTPIQLSAERIKRKFRPQVEVPEDLDQMTDVIVRQTNDLRRIVDEFSKFARMPEPAKKDEDVTALVQAAVLLQGSAQDITLKSDLPTQTVFANVDATMIRQALTNLIKNAGEAIETYIEKRNPNSFSPEVHVSMSLTEDEVVIQIADNGIGLPKDRARLFEPYVTTRDKGTGLGLPIVKKIIEEHGGSLQLVDAPVFEGNDHAGALAEIRLPRVAQTETLKIEETA
ncbi:PAS domain-containing sensor histidine kinase [Sulfitobacter sp. 1151]|uniref:histidine kinase n=2 Tax=Parasulfitobacter algicola TaxID=2614809 RepID=A0ABX2IXN8_9RHOB|nr:PAS domain-containing sensor histidine kinase [Sulfitobacter algicola]NSX55236.1 PAS domain-containing sensor histidine kinase [Sulfitobacter algicola]